MISQFLIFLGGNGLFDDILASTTTKEEMDSQLLELMKRHCPEKACPLAGSSIHVYREILRLRIPAVYNHLNHRIIDLSSLLGMVARWSTSSRWAETERHVDDIMGGKHRNIPNRGEAYRAVYDIERSIEILKLFKPCLATF